MTAPNLLREESEGEVIPPTPWIPRKRPLNEHPIVIALATAAIKILALFCTHQHFEVMEARNEAGELIHQRHVCRDCGKHIVKIAI